MKLLSALMLIGHLALIAADFETNTILIKNLDLGAVQRGLNKFSPVVVNKTESGSIAKIVVQTISMFYDFHGMPYS
jgi:hypothetical protein